MVSSPERYAAALNLTAGEVCARQAARLAASQELHRILSTDELSGAEKHAAQCRHRLKHGRHPFVCGRCWSYLPVCVCARAAATPAAAAPRDGAAVAANPGLPQPHSQFQPDGAAPLQPLPGGRKHPLPEGVAEVVVWVHHKEWGLTSNTGGLLALCLDRCTLLMKGLPEHDAQLERLLKDPTVDPVVLWPARTAPEAGRGEAAATAAEEEEEEEGDKKKESRGETAASLAELRARYLRSPPPGGSGGEGGGEGAGVRRRLVLIAVDSTWRGASGMVGKLPRDLPRLGLEEHELFWEDRDSQGGGNDGGRDDGSGGALGTTTSSAATATAAEKAAAAAAAASEETQRPGHRRKSLLAPLRKRKAGQAADVCTAEAVVAALRGLGLPEPACRHVLAVAKTKVDLTSRYRGKQTPAG